MRLKSFLPWRAPLSDLSTLGTPSGSSAALAGIFQMIQCVHVPTGASGSSTMSASESAPAGTSSQLNAGERSAPSHVYLLAISPLFANADDFNAKDIARSPCIDRKSTRLNSSHLGISYAVFCLKK